MRKDGYGNENIGTEKSKKLKYCTEKKTLRNFCLRIWSENIELLHNSAKKADAPPAALVALLPRLDEPGRSNLGAEALKFCSWSIRLTSV